MALGTLNYIIDRDCTEWARRFIRILYEDLSNEDSTGWVQLSAVFSLDLNVWH